MPTEPARTYIAFRIAEMQFSTHDASVLVLALAAALLSALNLWRVGQSEDRQKRLFEALRRTSRHRPDQSLPPRTPWYQQFGTLVAATRLIGETEQKRLLAGLVAAGIKGHGHLAALVTAKVWSAAAFVPICWMVLEWRQFFDGAPGVRSVFLAGALILGWRCPDVALSRLTARRRKRLEIGIPDALDLLVICAEAGLSLDHAIEQVARVLHSSSPEVAEEFGATAAEMRVLAVRGQALENLAQRAGIANLRSIVVALNQSMRFGTPLAGTLRLVAAEMRAERLARFEERAARLPVLLTLPLMAFILPSLLLVIGAPLALRIIDMLGRGF